MTVVRVFRGPLIHSASPSDLVVINDGVLAVDTSGKIVLVGEARDHADLLKEHAKIVQQLSPTQFLIPGFVDTHIHAPQYSFTGTGYDKPLLEWLETYTFPQESKFKSVEHAKNCYEKVVDRTLRNGTTTACYFGTIHLDACRLLAEILRSKGQRAYVGKVNMDRNSPDYYIESTQASIQDTIAFVESFPQDSDLVLPVITPRFVPTCTSQLMSFLGKYACEKDLFVQSHISDNLSEIDWVKALHPELKGYADVYQQYGLLNHRTIMAHCIHLTPQERLVFKQERVGIAHCPNSNFALQSGVCNVRQLFDEGIDKIGLGTDVGGGYSPSILDAMRQSMIASKVVYVQSQTASKQPDEVFKPLKLEEVFYLATLGGARAVCLDHKIGNFEAGKAFDALLVDMDGTKDGKSQIDLFPHDDLLAMFEKFVYLGDDRHISQVFVQGRKVVY
jgi:guanine deaminase